MLRWGKWFCRDRYTINDLMEYGLLASVCSDKGARGSRWNRAVPAVGGAHKNRLAGCVTAFSVYSS